MKRFVVTFVGLVFFVVGIVWAFYPASVNVVDRFYNVVTVQTYPNMAPGLLLAVLGGALMLVGWALPATTQLTRPNPPPPKTRPPPANELQYKKVSITKERVVEEIWREAQDS